MDWYEKGMGERFSTFHAVLLAIWLAVLVWSGINPHDRLTWWLECTPGLIGFALLALTWGKFRFSRFCYALIAIHCVILFIGAKYTYAEVPLFTWLEGPLHFARNNYDKVGHFAQGAFPAIIAREIILRTRAARSKAWAAFFSITVCLSIAALYEIFEWATAEIIHEEAAGEYMHTYMPSPQAVLKQVVPNYAKGLIFGAMIEAYASEQNARMTAMDNATTNAEEIIRSLTLRYNRVRQAAITTELNEVVSGAAAQE